MMLKPVCSVHKYSQLQSVVSPVATHKALCTADVCASVLQLHILDDEGAVWQDLKTLSLRVDRHHHS